MIGLNFTITQLPDGKSVKVSPAPRVDGQTPLEVELLDATIQNLGKRDCRVLAGLLATRAMIKAGSE